MTHNAVLLLITAIAIVGLVLLIVRGKLHAFIALTLASLFVGLCAGGNPLLIVRSFVEGAGSILGSIAFVIALGTVLGKTLGASSGAERIAMTLVGAFGERRAHWAMALGAFLIGIPVFFSVGLVLLIPVAFAIARQVQAPRLRLALPLVAGLSVAHALVPPHPGPAAAVELLKADVGKTILYSLLIGLPTAMICGPILGAFLAQREKVEPVAGLATQLSPASGCTSAPGFGLALLTLLLPVLLMMGATTADFALPPSSTLRRWADLLGNPLVAMLVAVLFSFWSFGYARGFDRHQLGLFSEECLAPLATILLVVGAGAGFSRVLINSGVGDALALLARDSGISPLLLGWLLTASIRVATGSATVAITTAAGLLAPISAATPGLNRELLVVAMGAGSVILSHVNDSGFWLVKEYLNLDVTQTLKTWTVMETAISLTALALLLPLSLVL
jgi:gluconate:H+ symporter, GntP family